VCSTVQYSTVQYSTASLTSHTQTPIDESAGRVYMLECQYNDLSVMNGVVLTDFTMNGLLTTLTSKGLGKPDFSAGQDLIEM